MNQTAFSALAHSRHCKRAFLSREVPESIVEEALRTAAQAPSSRNTQPWAVAVLTGDAKSALADKLSALFDAGAPLDPQFLNNPAELEGAFEQRARAVGAATFKLKGIDRQSAEQRRRHLRDNMAFYGAPLEMIFHLPGDAVPGSFLALGCFLQNVMLGLAAGGLGCCPQYSVAGYAAAIRRQLALPSDRLIVCGLAVGYANPAAPINTLIPERAPLEDYVKWHV